MSEPDVHESDALADRILNQLGHLGVDANNAQAALGSAWVRLVYALGWSKERFFETCTEILGMWDELGKKDGQGK